MNKKDINIKHMRGKKFIDYRCGRCGGAIIYKPIYDKDNLQWLAAMQIFYLGVGTRGLASDKFALCRKCNNSFFKWLSKYGWKQ